MEAFITLLVIVGVVILVRRSRRSRQIAEPTNRRKLTFADRGVTTVHHPATPSGQPVQAWGGDTTRTEIVGEAYREGAFINLWRQLTPLPDGSRESNGTALIVDDSANPHDRNAVAVWFGGQCVGYLDRQTARTYSKAVQILASQGKVLEVRGRVWVRRNPDRVHARVSVWLPPVSSINPSNPLPSAPFVVLPMGAKMQVTKESEHMDVLGKYVVSGVSSPIAVTLHSIQEVRPRSVIEAVEVRIDGERIGILSATTSQQMLPVVRHVEARGKIAVAHAAVTGSSLQAEVTLFVARSADVDDWWLSSIGPVVPVVVEYADHFPQIRPEPMWDDEGK